ncbi:hypothetical protein L6164_022412 [Bauhinia variegata]|uniref:Uncharacterized protein n=1 Tax=Bauhinia variegata TaxID=167791 RepID=A0ACB9MFJ4_BAUVA|nr:hypothetical protein L6164_022412 [Bauhinia variegata]
MSVPDPRIADEDLPSETPSILEDQQCEDRQNPHCDSQSSKTLTLDDRDPQQQAERGVSSVQVAQEPEHPEDSFMEEQADPQIVDDPDDSLAPSPRNTDASVGVSAATTRRGTKRKKFGQKRTAQEKRYREKFEVLVKTLKPIPFIPAKVLDFTSHEALLRRIGLWDFVHIEFDRSIRGDLIAQLIAGYTPGARYSYVNNVKIMVNRADLGRALKLPPKKPSVSEDVMETPDLAESVAFIQEVVSNWMLLHEDTFIMPSDILSYTNLIKEGNFERVDWAGLIWSMMDKELRATQLINCYYASHLQQLIKFQHEELLREEPNVEVKDEEEEEEVQEDEGGSGDVKMGGVDEGQTHELAEHNIELSLGQDNIDKVEVEKAQVGGEHAMDFEESKEGEPGQWDLDRKNDAFLRHCSVDHLKNLDCGQKKDEEGEKGQEGEDEEEQEEEEEEAEEDEHEGGFHLLPKGIPLEGMSSGSLTQAMEAAQMPFSSGVELRDNSVGDFLSSREDAQMISGASLFGNGHKRDLDLDNHNSHHSLNGSNKRMRSDNTWDSKPVDFDTCMEHIQNWMGKARMVYATKEQACEESNMTQQIFLDELHKRDSMIDHLNKARMEDIQKRQMEVYRLEKELYMMTNLLDGYRKALKETHKAFSEYRARFPQVDEPLYKDVPGSGGLVLSVMDYEKEHLKQEEEEKVKRLAVERKLRDIEEGWIGKMEDYQHRIESLNNRLLAVEDKLKLLNEVKAKHKVLEPPESASDPPERDPSE